MLRNLVLVLICLTIIKTVTYGQITQDLCKLSAVNSVFLRSKAGYKGKVEWKIKKVGDVREGGKEISSRTYRAVGWLPAIVPGTVLNTLVYNKIYPEPYFGDNNRKTKKLIPDIADAGRKFYHYWFRTEFRVSLTSLWKRWCMI